MVVVVVGSAGGVGAATVAVVSNPGPGLPGDVVGVTSLTDTLIGPKSFLDGSLRNPLINQFIDVRKILTTSRGYSKYPIIIAIFYK